MNKLTGLDDDVARLAKLPLPRRLEQLYRQFELLETIAMMTFTRKQRLTFDDAQRSIARSGSKTLPKFTIHTMARIIHVYPRAYTLKAEPLVTKSVKTRAAQEFVYVLQPNLRNDVYEYYTPPLVLPPSPVKSTNGIGANDVALQKMTPTKEGLISPTKRPKCNLDYITRSPLKSVVEPQARDARPDPGPKFEPWRRQCRAAIFKYKLHKYVRAEHCRWLRENKVKFNANDEDALHPDFNLDKHIAELPLAALPSLNSASTPAQKSMRDYLDSVSKSAPPVLSPQLSGERKLKPINLLERIREKERLKREANERRDTAAESRVEHLERLEMIMPTLISEYARRTSFENADLFARIHNSIKTLKRDVFEKTIKLLVELTDGQFKLVELNGKHYLQATDTDFDGLIDHIEAELKRERAALPV